MPIRIKDMSANKIKLQKTKPHKSRFDKVDISNPIESPEKIIRKQNVFLNTILNSLTHPFLIIDANDYTIKKHNRMTSPEDLRAGTTCFELTHGSNKPCSGKRHTCPVMQIKKTKKPVIVEHIHIDREGNRKVFELHGFPIFSETGEVSEIIEYLLDITERKRAEIELQKTYSRLVTEQVALRHKNVALKKVEAKLQTTNERLIIDQVALRGKNVALKEILNRIGDEKKQLGRVIQSNVNRTIMPILKKLEEKTGSVEKEYIKILENSLSEITSPFISQLEKQFTELTPREIEICNMIKDGLSSKEIASAFDISDQTVIKHRKKIRKKLGIGGQKVNLVSHLKSLPNNTS